VRSGGGAAAIAANEYVPPGVARLAEPFDDAPWSRTSPLACTS
jgi:hypothetical protein